MLGMSSQFSPEVLVADVWLFLPLGPGTKNTYVTKRGICTGSLPKKEFERPFHWWAQ